MDYPCGGGPVKGKKVIEPMTKEERGAERRPPFLFFSVEFFSRPFWGAPFFSSRRIVPTAPV
jgi:hypothetical protein